MGRGRERGADGRRVEGGLYLVGAAGRQTPRDVREGRREERERDYMRFTEEESEGEILRWRKRGTWRMDEGERRVQEGRKGRDRERV